jgi:predicted RNA-binding protein with PUA-like domain
MSVIVKDLLYSIQFELSNDELDQVLAAVKYRRSQLTQCMRRQLQVGDTVKFYHSRYNQTLQGSVAKVAIKYVTVSTTKGRWKVPASMLEVA